MKGSVYSLEGKILREVDLPPLFSRAKRVDLIKRAVLSDESKEYQPKGNYKYAGMETSARYRGRKDDYGTTKNMGIAHRPREVLPEGRYGRVKRIPSAVKGRRAHPPKPEKKIVELMNKKEYKAAMLSALAFVADGDEVNRRMNIQLSLSFPIVLDNSFEKLKRTKEILAVMKALNLEPLIQKAKKRKAKGPLIVVGEKRGKNPGNNIPGVDIIDVNSLKVKNLAPGCHPGRLTIFTERALDELEKMLAVKR